ncbi:MAG: LacI family transcriptional regulator [Armatimonadetes bacterium]|nr:LacI family transcriptional regulator [Armatimonadota bacterium]
MAVTIKDIAQQLKISVSTVSYALNGGPRSVPDDVKKRVLALARELNYRPNRIARSMVTGRTHTIGVVPPEVTEDVFLSPYLHLALNGIANEARKHKQDILLFTRYNETDSEEMVSVLLDGRIDGVVFIAPHFNHKNVEMATSLHMPCVTVSGAPLEGVASFTVNNKVGMKAAMQHLYDLGHRKIGHIAGRDDMPDAILRLEAYREFIQSHDLPFHERWVGYGEFKINEGRDAMRKIMSQADCPTAITCGNDEMAIGALHEALQMGLRVPQDVSIVGFDMSQASTDAVLPLTTVRQPVTDLSVAAVKALMIFIEGGPSPETFILNPELVVRASTARPTHP